MTTSVRRFAAFSPLFRQFGEGGDITGLVQRTCAILGNR